jgi:hypothetical protein
MTATELALELPKSICALTLASGLPPHAAYAATQGAALRMWINWMQSRPHHDDVTDELAGTSGAMRGIVAVLHQAAGEVLTQ